MNETYKTIIREGAILAIEIDGTYRPLVIEKIPELYDNTGKIKNKTLTGGLVNKIV
jgi:hypothetical protein